MRRYIIRAGHDPSAVVNLCPTSKGAERCAALVHLACYLDPEIPMNDQLRKCARSPGGQSTCVLDRFGVRSVALLSVQAFRVLFPPCRWQPQSARQAGRMATIFRFRPRGVWSATRRLTLSSCAARSTRAEVGAIIDSEEYTSAAPCVPVLGDHDSAGRTIILQ